MVSLPMAERVITEYCICCFLYELYHPHSFLRDVYLYLTLQNELTINKLLNSPANYRASYDEHGRFVLLVASEPLP
jgi:hypothetical protein